MIKLNPKDFERIINGKATSLVFIRNEKGMEVAIRYLINLVTLISMSVFFMLKRDVELTLYVLAPLPVFSDHHLFGEYDHPQKKVKPYKRLWGN